MADWRVHDLPLGPGRIGIAPIPGRTGTYERDLTALLAWQPGLVLTMTAAHELERTGAAALGDDLAAVGVAWRHLPIHDFGAPDDAVTSLWPEVSKLAHATLDSGGRVLAHCYGGCGRSGMALMRLMVEAGEDADAALERLREVRPCAVETEDQKAWAAKPMYDRLGWSP